jgi:DNA (cytosine-5)-methyltransferase 1
MGNCPSPLWHTKGLRAAYQKLPSRTKAGWIWWQLPTPPPRKTSFADIIEPSPADASWYSAAQTRNLLNMMSELNCAKLQRARMAQCPMVGGLYRRTRKNGRGRKIQRAEIRFDLAGCLRTPAGGSSRQVVLIVDGNSVRARLLSSRETARLMGLPDAYTLPANYNDAYHITGDGVVVPVVRYLAHHLFEPILNFSKIKNHTAA